MTPLDPSLGFNSLQHAQHILKLFSYFIKCFINSMMQSGPDSSKMSCIPKGISILKCKSLESNIIKECE